MGLRFKNSRSRLERARTHRASFESEWASFWEKKGEISVTPDDKRAGWWIVRMNLPTEAIERMRRNTLSLVLGEFAYQLRAALDGLIWEAIAIMQGTEIAPDAKGIHRLEFPLSSSWKATDTEEGRFHGFPFPKNLVDWMRSIQHGTAPKPFGHPDRGLEITLQDIHNLARHDRHRRLRVVSTWPTKEEIHIIATKPPGGRAIAHEWLGCDPLNGKYEIVRIKLVCPGGLIPYQVDLQPHFAFTVLAEDIEQYEVTDMGVQLDRFIGAVEHVINRFEREFT